MMKTIWKKGETTMGKKRRNRKNCNFYIKSKLSAEIVN